MTAAIPMNEPLFICHIRKLIDSLVLMSVLLPVLTVVLRLCFHHLIRICANEPGQMFARLFVFKYSFYVSHSLSNTEEGEEGRSS